MGKKGKGWPASTAADTAVVRLASVRGEEGRAEGNCSLGPGQGGAAGRPLNGVKALLALVVACSSLGLVRLSERENGREGMALGFRPHRPKGVLFTR